MMFNKFSVSLCLILVCDFMDERKFVGSCFVCVGGGGGEIIFCRVKWLNTEEGGGRRARGKRGTALGRSNDGSNYPN